MLQIIQQWIIWNNRKNRWWIPLITGVPFSLCLPPFNHEFHPLFALFPFFSFFALMPLLFFSLRKPRGRAVLHVYLFSCMVTLGQYFWIAFVAIEGLWILIIIGMVLLSAFVALFYLAAGMIFRWCYYRFPRFYLIIFPACWVLIEYARALGEPSFPWGFLGYIFTPLLPLSQLASFTGVWGLSFVIVLGNLFVLEWFVNWYRGRQLKGRIIQIMLFCGALGMIAVFGHIRLRRISGKAPLVRIALIQSAIDQFNWGKHSLDTAFSINESLIYSAAQGRPDLIVGPESALLCYLARQRVYGNRVHKWVDSVNIPVLLGALHWDKPRTASPYEYHVYNTAFLILPHEKQMLPYRKIKLVPFSEAFPFEGIFPILSRVNLGEADFQKGTESTVYSIGDSVRAAPFICYESIYPGFVRKRLRKGANLIVHITNDGWFGKTTGPYQHATMARMRVIENGVSMARCANTGISMLVDPTGRVLEQTDLYNRTILEGMLPLSSAATFYARFGDWFILLCLMIVSGAVLSLFIKPLCTPLPGKEQD
jgi:apolipoprotein N-acyltransferase